MARTPQTISPNAARNHPLTGAPTSTTASRLGSYSPNDKPQRHPKAATGAPTSPKAPPEITTKVHPTAPRASDEPFFFPRPQKCSPHLAQTPHALPTQPKHHHRAPKPLPFSLLETPQNHPFARTPKAASVNSYSKPAISYNAPRKVLPLTGACLPLHCHQDRNEIQIKK